MTPSARKKRAPSAERAQSMIGSQASAWRSTSAVGAVGTVADEVGRRKAQDVLEHRLRVGGDAVDRRVDEPRDRHRHRIDLFALRGKLVGDQRAPPLVGRHDRRAGRRPHRLAVEPHGKAFRGRLDRDGLVEALGHRRLHLDLGAPHRVRVGKLLARFEIVEDVAHAVPTALCRCGRLTMIRPAPISASARKMRMLSGSSSSRPPHSTPNTGVRNAKLESPAAG